MQNEEQTTNQSNPTIVQPGAPAVSDVTVDPMTNPVPSNDTNSSSVKNAENDLSSVMKEVIARISESNNILIALSSDPSVDDLATAIGFSLYLDRIGKRATAIYSGTTPNALEFLKPEDTFEATADTLQDFVIALSKDKADHLRYKLDGDYVKIFITPYKKRIDETDLDFSYGDYNVDLVLALDVNNGMDLDSALREYGRIMHDATVINITTGNPGKFGEIEWSDTSSSSVSEMIGKLLCTDENEAPLEKDEATAFLTGIIAATDRFSKANTTPETMRIASRLMESGADQQLISKNITSDISNQLSLIANGKKEENEDLSSKEGEKEVNSNSTELSVEHDDEEESEPEEKPAKKAEEESTPEIKLDSTMEPELEPAPEFGAVSEPATLESAATEPSIEGPDSALLDDLKAAEASLAGAAAETTEEVGNEPVRIEESTNQDEKVIEPSADFLEETPESSPNKYGEMLEAALAEADATPAQPAEPVMSEPEPVAPVAPVAPAPAPAMPAPAPAMPAPAPAPVAPVPAMPAPEPAPVAPVPEAMPNPAAAAAPAAPASPEINGVPEMNYEAVPNEELLPPPPTPPVDLNNPMPASSAFQIPGM